MDSRVPSQGSLIRIVSDEWNISVIIPEGRGADAIRFAWTFHKMPSFGPQVISIIRQHASAFHSFGGVKSRHKVPETNEDFRDFGIAFAAVGLLFFSAESIKIVEEAVLNGKSVIEIGISDALVLVSIRTKTSVISFEVVPPFSQPAVH